MPATAEAQAAKAQRQKRQARHYRPNTLGALCVDGCGLRLPVALTDLGIHGHPTCGAEAASLGLHRDAIATPTRSPR